MEQSHESVFIGMLRSFCKTIAIIFAFLLAFLALIIVLGVFSTEQDASHKTHLKILPDVKGSQKVLSLHAPAILQVKIEGVIGTKELNAENIQNILLASQSGFLKNQRVKGILLHINSPGGGVFDSDSIYRALLEYKKKYQTPIYAYVDGMCASGALLIGCAADKIYSCPVGVIGSVGVIMGPFFNFASILDKWDIKSATLSKGEDKDPMNPFRTWKKDEGKDLQNVIDSVYTRFVDIVTKARPNISKKQLLSAYGAKIYPAQQAMDLGFVDYAGMTYNETLQALVDEAKITGEYQVVELKIKSSLFSNLVQNKASILHKIFFHSQNYQEPFSYLYHPHS